MVNISQITEQCKRQLNRVALAIVDRTDATNQTGSWSREWQTRSRSDKF